ncbi:DEAD/DEAH box helicase domain-containing protein [Nitrosospira sp. Nsp2]|uniref:DEAD/DEAH box helicase n=1 Tax=Nitrosospira sp. Nsp2 TaxID=136548 RepID=UPI000D2F67E6|nr:DEAD/DEAH box helicase [Nitrosospira sp. Nsp2]PTR17227.1 DEAD/DEAH box helicase domain-containing protein [Nitrosospira sp. Nsp2]
MLPSLLTKDIRTGLKQFLIAGFEPADAFMHGLMSRFVEDESTWLKGPYVQIGLPFVDGSHGRKFFSTFETQYPSYSHQEQAWNRLSSQHMASSTLVATGTGSGKTECFLYPVLDYCARVRATGEAGIKALVIYPLNALASDQAQRIAQLLASVPAFSQLRVGLYVGGRQDAPGTGMVMTPDNVISDRDTLRKQPPDILLTNYKMLDYLMLRPQDRQLWSANTPETLRYVVVDELHTFDGAQGTDLALLLRRLRARLKTPAGHLICAGTSATLGGASDSSPLRDYARQIFGVPFGPDSVVTENRQSVGDFLEDATVDYMFPFRPEAATRLEPSLYASPEAAVQDWYDLFFPNETEPVDVKDPAWRKVLGQRLKQHQLFVNLLKHLKGGVVDAAELKQAFARNMPTATDAQICRVLDALLVLVAWALRDGNQPLVTLRMQLWVRELRRMVGKLSMRPDDVVLRSERDLPSQRDGVYLPMVQCTQCRTTGWLSRLVQGTSKLSTKLDEIYNTWFSGRPEVARFYASSSVRQSHVDGVTQRVCGACGNLQATDGACLACGHQELLSIFRVTAQRSQVFGQAQFTRHDNTCPACGERNALLLLGARNATLGSQVVEATWASVFNDDKKLIAFSDSVQDAAHRAGFFGARTYLNNVRMALAQVMDEVAQVPLPWSEFLARTKAQFDHPGSVLHMDDERLVSEFIGPNMTWQRDWATELPEHLRLPAGSRLPGRVKKRLLWQAVSEMTYLSTRGRTLERIGKATLSVPWERLMRVAEFLTPKLREQFGAHGLDQKTVAQWLWGTLTHMRRRGGVMHPELANYAGDGNVYALLRGAGRGGWMPVMGDYTAKPVFLTLGKQREFDKLTQRGRAIWYERWADRVLGQQTLLAAGMTGDMYRVALEVLRADGILVLTAHHLGDTLALNPDALQLDTDVAFVATPGSQRRLAVPRSEVAHFLGMPCLDAVESTYEVRVPETDGGWAHRYSQGSLRRVIAAEHTGLLERTAREALEQRFKDKNPKPWFENLLSATPTLEMGVDIGDLSSVLLCSVPPSQASFLQRIGRAGRVDGNAVATTLADGNSPHDLYFFSETQEMIAGEVSPPGIFLQAAEVLRRQLFAFCMDDWAASLSNMIALPQKTSQALDAVQQDRRDRFPYIFCDYVLEHEQRLFDAFMALLAEDATDRVRERLWNTMQGQGEGDGLRTRLTKVLEELVEERCTYKKRKDELDKVRARLKQRPQDEATQAEGDQLMRERDSMLELIKEINGRDLLNTLTDAGLIPNYAFPEAGIELKSVLWRKREPDEPGSGAYVTLKTLKYERPAQSALSEFAPENRFYANQRRVQVDQINMNLAQAENWRFCPACHHMQHLGKEPVEHAVCPHCGDAMWADAAQKRTLLRFKQAIANSNDADVRIDDTIEDREPKFYVRQLMADFLPSSIREAWQISSGDLPFGFEFISRVTFRDVNFGELAKPGEAFKVADVESARPGFCLCRHCGKVQKPIRRNGQAQEQTHSFDCPKHGSEDPANLLDCLYLYREFESEALRILVPYTKNGVDERVVQSFMAAVQLGVKKRFGGKVDHLRMVLQDEPGKDGGPRKHYVLLYDSVPGGTGYLHQLLAQDAKTLADILRMALDALTTCSCNHDPEKDGCYRCLYQYRLGRNMELVSRDTAKSVMTDLVNSLGELERVKTISDIYINPNFDSVLEARFIESLKRLGGTGGLPVVKLVSDIVNGKSGYVLEVGKQRYRIEPQCELDAAQGVSVWSKPDFMIWPWSATSRRRPIAVFCDGWVYHKDKISEDARKRSAIVNSSAFWVWSVTHQDVVAALDGVLETDLESPLVAMSRHDGSRAPNTVPRAQEKAYTQHAVARLLQWLAAASEGQENDAALEPLQRNALWLSFLSVPSTPTDRTDCEQQLTRWLPRLPESVVEPGTGFSGTGFAPSVSRAGDPCLLIGYWPLALAGGLIPAQRWSAPGVVLLDGSAAPNEEVLHRSWRRWLQLYNAMQVLPGMLLTTAEGLDAHDYDGLSVMTTGEAAAPVRPGDHAALQQAWLEALEQVLDELKPGLALLARAGAVIPEVGWELVNGKGEVVADAEMAWPRAQLVILRPDQEDLISIWNTAGWTILMLDETHIRVENQPWFVATAAALGLELELDTQE